MFMVEKVEGGGGRRPKEGNTRVESERRFVYMNDSSVL
jgi:hypothetical protein